jgi:hypothetical protein
MVKTIYIHIGGYNKGTSVLQKFLSENRVALKNKGYLYPGRSPGHHEMVKGLKTQLPPEGVKPQDPIIHKYLEEIKTSKCDNIILSSEGFEKLGKSIENLKLFFNDRSIIKIIFYITRQDEQLEAVYHQRVLQNGVRLDIAFTDFFRGFNFDSLNYFSILKRWEQAFGKENIIVRCYDKEQMPEGIYSDFLECIGLTLDENYSVLKRTPNHYLNWDFIEVIRICNSHFKDNIAFHRFLVQSLEQVNSTIEEEREILLSPLKRTDTIARYTESNAKVAREYLGRPDGRLFYASLPDLDESWKPYDGLTVEKIVPIFTQMMFNLESKYQRQRKTIENRRLNRRILIGLKKIGRRLGLLE